MKKILVYLLSAVLAFLTLVAVSNFSFAIALENALLPGFIIALFFLTLIFSATLFFIINIVKKNKKT